jgi:glutamate--cysteine ligase
LSSHLQTQLQALSHPDLHPLLANIGRGIEKESLRVTPDGTLAQTPHPAGLGSALTHSSITTDYSEALLEFITPVNKSIEQSLETLEDIHSYVYQQLDHGEILWATSMPCVMAGDEGIPVAQYGSSNVARMKTVYRHGLGHRYGRLMQAIAGIHYNFSMPGAYWQHRWEAAGSPGDLQDFISEGYLGLIRNFKRYSWLLIYLLGASPAVCRSFLKGRDNHGLQPFSDGGHSLHLPYGTALRMGDLGYNSDAQKNLKICYNSLDNYIDTLHQAIVTPHPAYQQFNCGQGGEYQQLNASLLQIENEFYSPIRPKRVARSGETPLNALDRAGIEYIEVRCVDVNPFSPVGLDAQTIRFLDSFLLYCLMEDSPPCDDADQQLQASNMEAVVNRGREPGLMLQTADGEKSLRSWGEELMAEVQDIASLMDSVHGGSQYAAASAVQVEKLADPELTPSARVLREMREGKTFFRLGLSYSQHWAEHFQSRELSPRSNEALIQETRRSLQAQREVEASDSISFDQYVANFYAQYEAL